MAIVFPDNPSDGQVFTYEDSVFVFNSAKNRWSSQSFASVESTFEQIKTSLDYLGVDTSTVSLSNVAEVIKTHNVQDYTPKVQVAEEYVRPSDWISMPSMTASDEKFVGLFAVMPNDTNAAYIYAQGNYTVDWGDGTSEDISSGQYAYKSYDFSSFDASDSTLTSKGYKQALITVTPQEGQSVSTFYLHNRPSTEREDSASNWLDIKVSFPNCTNFTINTYSGNRYARMLESVDILNIKDSTMYGWFDGCYSLKKVRVKSSAQVTSLQYLFLNCRSLKKVDLFDVNTSSCTNFISTFNSCVNLIELPEIDISSGTNFDGFLTSCFSLQNIPAGYTFDSATNLTNSFSNCYSLLEMPNILSQNVSSYYRTFLGCYSLHIIKDSLPSSNCTNFREMFSGCSSLTTTPTLDTSSGTNFINMFSGCSNLENIIGNIDTSQGTTLSGMFNGCIALRKIPPGFSSVSATNLSNTFASCRSIESLPEMDTSKVTTFYQFAPYCYSLKTVPLYDTSLSTNFYRMFSYCYRLDEVPDFNTQSGTNFEDMFLGCSSLKKAPKLNTSSATTTQEMFSSCTSLQEINASDFDLSSCLNVSSMFNGCSSLTTITGQLSIPYATTANSLFYGCASLQSVDINIPTGSCSFSSIFRSCISLKEIKNLDFQNATLFGEFSYLAYSLSSIKNVTNISQSIDFRQTNLDASDFVDLFTNSLSTVSGKTILINGAPGATELTAEQIAIATNKGWTVTT